MQCIRAGRLGQVPRARQHDLHDPRPRLLVIVVHVGVVIKRVFLFGLKVDVELVGCTRGGVLLVKYGCVG